jgi:hypothetical protein
MEQIMKTYNNCSLTSQEALDDALIERQKIDIEGLKKHTEKNKYTI